MNTFFNILVLCVGSIVLLFLLNYISYQLMKHRILNTRIWDLNICCGKTDGGGINADIMEHAEVNNYCHIDNIYKLPRYIKLPFSHKLQGWIGQRMHA